MIKVTSIAIKQKTILPNAKTLIIKYGRQRLTKTLQTSTAIL